MVTLWYVCGDLVGCFTQIVSLDGRLTTLPPRSENFFVYFYFGRGSNLTLKNFSEKGSSVISFFNSIELKLNHMVQATLDISPQNQLVSVDEDLLRRIRQCDSKTEKNSLFLGSEVKLQTEKISGHDFMFKQIQ